MTVLETKVREYENWAIDNRVSVVDALNVKAYLTTNNGDISQTEDIFNVLTEGKGNRTRVMMLIEGRRIKRAGIVDRWKSIISGMSNTY